MKRYAKEMIAEAVGIGVESVDDWMASASDEDLLEALFPLWDFDHIGILKRRGKAPHYMAWIATKPCVVCGATPIEVHHEPHRSQGGSDYDTVPLCKFHHDCLHQKADSGRFAEEFGHFDRMKAKSEFLEVVLKAKSEFLVEYIRRREGR